jgi:diadenosine tetraphosphate (Ap4A) HIT family hydrolase
MNELIIFQTDHWIASHRSDSRYLGYLMLSSVQKAAEISFLDAMALADLGRILKIMEKLLLSTYTPHKVIMSKLGFTSGFNVHFHVVPISLDLLQELKHTNAEPDGIDAHLFICRKYCEKVLTVDQAALIKTEVAKLKEAYKFAISTEY